MTHRSILLIVCCALLTCGCVAAPTPADTKLVGNDSVVLPDSTNAVRFRFYTNASPKASHLFNTFDIEAYGEFLVPSLRAPAHSLFHNCLVNGEGPRPAGTNHITLVNRAAGPEWSYVALDATAAYQGEVEKFKRSILFVEPDLFVLYDHIETKEPSSLQLLLQLPATVRVDEPWRALRLALPAAGMTVHTPIFRNQSFWWEQIPSPVDQMITNTLTFQLAPTNKLAAWDLISVFALHRAGEKKEWAFKVLQSDTAFGARIFRDGLPTLVAFVTNPDAPVTGLAGYEFKGPVGVYVFRPKLRR